MVKKIVRVGTRKSPLALSQTKMVITELEAKLPEIRFELMELGTKGDRDKKTALNQFGQQGIFTDEIGQAIIAGQIDFAVHSLKDMPAELGQGLILASHPKRENPFDSLIMREATKIEELPVGGVIGTSSLRREIELLRLRPDLTPVSIRGNIDQRLKQLAEGHFDGIILANAGLNRLGWKNQEGFSVQSFTKESFIPSVGQGILALECREDDLPLQRLLSRIADEDTMRCAAAERAFLAGMAEGDDSQTSAAFATISEGIIVLTVMQSSRNWAKDYCRKEFVGEDARALGQNAAKELRRV